MGGNSSAIIFPTKERSVDRHVIDKKGVTFIGKDASEFLANSVEGQQLLNMDCVICHSNAHYHRKKLDKMFQNGQTPEALGQALNKMKIPDAISWP